MRPHSEEVPAASRRVATNLPLPILRDAMPMAHVNAPKRSSPQARRAPQAKYASALAASINRASG